MNKGPEPDANGSDGPAANSVSPSATQEISSVGAEPRQRRRTVVLVTVAAIAVLAGLGVWLVVDGKYRSENSPSVSPSVSSPQGDRGFFDTASVERQSVDHLTDAFSASKPDVSVKCPKDAPISAGSFTCSIRIGIPGDDVTGRVTYTLVREDGDALTIRGDYDFD